MRRARERRELGSGIEGRWFRLGTTEERCLVDRSGWVIAPVDVVSTRRYGDQTFLLVRVDGEDFTLVADSSTAARWLF
jgi:hypothetical protein